MVGINKGKIIGDKYLKFIEGNKAVLWKDRQLSIPPQVWNEITKAGVKYLIFNDKDKQWVFNYEDVDKIKVLKVEGQEKQYYFPIDKACNLK